MENSCKSLGILDSLAYGAYGGNLTREVLLENCLAACLPAACCQLAEQQKAGQVNFNFGLHLSN